ncbi:hypothetical protein D3C78_1163900 [compost metagenome]
MQVVQVLETALDRLGNGDRLGVGQGAEVAAGAGDDVSQQTNVGGTQVALAGQAPQRVQVLLAHVWKDQVLFMGNTDFAEAKLLGPIRHRLHLRGGQVARWRRGARLGRQHHAGIARDLVRFDAA